MRAGAPTAAILLAFTSFAALPGCSPGEREPPSPSFLAARDDSADPASEWRTYLGDLAATHRSPLADITRENVARLEVAWTYDAGGASTAAATQIQFNRKRSANPMFSVAVS